MASNRRKRHFSQIDRKWRNIPRYHQKSADALERLDRVLYELSTRYAEGLEEQARRALSRFKKEVNNLIDEGLRRGRNKNYSIELYGCWDCCICMIASDYQISFYTDIPQKRLEPTPENLLIALRSWRILSPIGYSHDIFTDPLAVITKARLQLFLHRDFGENGITVNQIAGNLINWCQLMNISVVVAVKKHPVFGWENFTHWVVLDVAEEDKQSKLMMRDPERRKIARFSYRKIFCVCIYSLVRGTKKRDESALSVDVFRS